MTKEANVKNYYKKKYLKNYLKEKYEIKINMDIMSRIIDNLRKRAFPYTRNLKMTVMELLGCSKEQLEEFIISKFTEKMSLQNYGEWEMDHIKPLASFNLNNIDEVKKCFHYTNLQPLWLKDNRSKGARYHRPSTIDHRPSPEVMARCALRNEVMAL